MAPRVLVVGSLNVDLYQKLDGSAVKFGGKPINLADVKGMTLPSKSFVEQPGIAKQFKASDLTYEPGQEESIVLTMDGPFEQKTGGKGANAAAAAGQTFQAELICNFGKQSEAENKMLRADLSKYGKVDTRRSGLIEGPTGTAYILNYQDGDNAIVLIGGANQSWIDADQVTADGSDMGKAIEDSVAVMLQREVPEYVNVEVAKAARKKCKPVFMDVGGTDAPIDEKLLPYISEIAPNETELTFISGVKTQGAGDEIDVQLVRKAVNALKAKFAAAGNLDVEVLVTLGKHGSAHFASKWKHEGATDILGLLLHETQMGSFKLRTEDGMPKDTTGAGDCFRGSYVAARYGQGKDIQEAMKWGAAAGSLAVEVVGAMPSMPTSGAIADRAKNEVSGGLFTTGAVEMKVGSKKPKGFYIQAALSFMRGVEAKPAKDGKDALEAKPPVDTMRISGLGDAIGTAVAAAQAVEKEKAGRICSVKTAYPQLGRRVCGQIMIDILSVQAM